jgi:hypothetical protein
MSTAAGIPCRTWRAVQVQPQQKTEHGDQVKPAASVASTKKDRDDDGSVSLEERKRQITLILWHLTLNVMTSTSVVVVGPNVAADLYQGD